VATTRSMYPPPLNPLFVVLELIGRIIYSSRVVVQSWE